MQRRTFLSGATASGLILATPFSTVAANCPIQNQDVKPFCMARLSDLHLIDSHRANEPFYIASISKMMAALVVFSHIRDGRMEWNDDVLMTKAAAAERPSKSVLHTGDTISVEKCLKYIAVRSANDLTHALAVKCAGTHDAFIAKMNAMAREIGMSENTIFFNSHGYPGTDCRHNQATPRDIVYLLKHLQEHYTNEYTEIFSLNSTKFRQVPYWNDGRAILQGEGETVKTGYSRDAGFCAAFTCEQDGEMYGGVVLGRHTRKERDQAVFDLMNSIKPYNTTYATNMVPQER